MADIILDLFVIFFLLCGIFFMFVAAIGLLRLPDMYHRMHAATKGVTLGLSSLIVAAAIHHAQAPNANVINIITKVILVILFQFIANPIGSHLLAKAAKMDGCPVWDKQLSDEEHDPVT
ncbi:MAG: monovalent cation/H(+) antiporter subunit G [Phycisphaeraceae bacterium]|nr:monovalent cation/H(+) antiporter subunit G [Phycisphaeraceae bacterium]